MCWGILEKIWRWSSIVKKETWRSGGWCKTWEHERNWGEREFSWVFLWVMNCISFDTLWEMWVKAGPRGALGFSWVIAECSNLIFRIILPRLYVYSIKGTLVLREVTWLVQHHTKQRSATNSHTITHCFKAVQSWSSICYGHRARCAVVNINVYFKLYIKGIPSWQRVNN